MIATAGPGTRPALGWQIRLAELGRHFALIGIAGVVTGVVVGGAGGRLLMRLSAIAAPDFATGASTEGGNVVGAITFEGTLALFLFVGVLSGLVGAVAYVLCEPWLQWAGRWRGAVLGLVLVAVGGAGVFDPGNRDFLILGHQELNVAMLLLLFPAFGVMLVPLVARLERRLPAVDHRRPIRSSWAYLALALFGSQFLFPFFLQFFSAEASGAETAPVAVGVAMLGVTAATILITVAALFGGGGERAVRRVRVAGHLSLLTATMLGVLRAVHDIGEILAL